MNQNDFDDFNRTEQSQEARGPEGFAEPQKKKHKGLKITAIVLACVLVVGSVAGLGYVAGDKGLFQPTDTTNVFVSAREPVEVEPVAVTGNRLMTMPEVYAANVGSAVSIRASTTTNYFGQAVESASAGSGFIITADGYIVTNYHVIDGSTKTTVALHDGTEFEAVVVGGDKDYDIAVLKVNPGETKLQPVVIGKSGSLHVGDSVAAIGNPLGELTFSMTSGIVSCVDRLINVGGTPFNMIQIDAAVNAGNSGGPLFNAYGEVVGIVSAKYSSSNSGASVEGLGFAIPIDDVISMIEDIMANGYVSNKASLALFGGNFAQSMNPEAGTDKGLYVYSVKTGGAAEKAGLQSGDIIVAIDGNTIGNMEDWAVLKKQYSAGDTATVEFFRSGEKQSTELTFDATPQAPEEVPTNAKPQDPNGGLPFDPWEYFEHFFGSPFFG